MKGCLKEGITVSLGPTLSKQKPLPKTPVRSADFGYGAGAIVAGKPLAHQVSPKQLLGSGACGLLEIFLKQQIWYWTGVLCTGRQLADKEIRIENALEDEHGKKTKLKEDAPVDITVEAETNATTPNTGEKR